MKVSDLKEYDPANFLKTAEDRASFITSAFEDGDPVIIRKAVGAVARSMGMEDIAEAANLNRKASIDRSARTAIPNCRPS